ncbi:helix-turn-helix transcriptional regulator [Saccharibacillus sacchari]|uniref:Helix-turn-helix transcriptional regulator n=1 Tax=Saccharibacillus sacchari TaxID=456493 RepID=A0ACC6PI87_9BACL
MSSINQRIKSRRLALGLTLAEVAERLGVKEATTQRYESGEIKNIKHETIAALAEILKCSPAYIMGWEEIVQQNDSLISESERSLLDKYRVLDEKGKHTVNTVLDMEYFRIEKPHLTVVAAHNDDMSDEQIGLMEQDLADLKEHHRKKRGDNE